MLVHRLCLDEKLKTIPSTTCEICKKPYIFTLFSNNTTTKTVSETNNNDIYDMDYTDSAEGVTFVSTVTPCSRNTNIDNKYNCMDNDPKRTYTCESNILCGQVGPIGPGKYPNYWYGSNGQLKSVYSGKCRATSSCSTSGNSCGKN